MKIISIENTWKFSQLIFLILIGLSGFYALERVCYIDSAYMLFRMVNSESIIAEGGRWINILPQILPWLFIKFGLPLKAIVICFSMSQMLLMYLLFLITGKYFNQKLLAILFLVISILSVNETFFDVVTETKYSLSFGILFSAFLLSEKNKNKLTGFLIILCGFFSHPNYIIYFIFILVYFKFFKPQTQLFPYLISGLILVLLKHLSIGTTTYETNILSDATDTIFQTLKNSFIHHYFGGLFSTQFLLILFVFLITLFHLYRSRNIREIIVHIISIASAYFILAIIYGKGDSQMMIQKTMLLFHFIILLPIVFLWFQLSSFFQKSILVIIVFSFFVSLYGIIDSSEKYVSRVNIIKDFLNILPEKSDKYLIREENINHDKMMATWALPHETLIISNISLNKNISVKNYREKNDTLYLSKFPGAFRPAFGYPLKNSELNKRYFQFNASKINSWLDSSIILGN